MNRRAKKSPCAWCWALYWLPFGAFALLPFVYMGLVSLTQKQRWISGSILRSSAKNYARVFNNFNIGRNLLNSVIVTAARAC